MLHIVSFFARLVSYWEFTKTEVQTAARMRYLASLQEKLEQKIDGLHETLEKAIDDRDRLQDKEGGRTKEENEALREYKRAVASTEAKIEARVKNYEELKRTLDVVVNEKENAANRRRHLFR